MRSDKDEYYAVIHDRIAADVAPGFHSDPIVDQIARLQLKQEALGIIKGLTKAQRMYVERGAIHGDCTMQTVRALQRKGLFHLVIDSPNGQAGFMRLTPLGQAVQAVLR